MAGLKQVISLVANSNQEVVVQEKMLLLHYVEHYSANAH